MAVGVGLVATVPPPANNVPDHLFNIIVGRLTASTATVRVLFHQSSTVLIQYGIVREASYAAKREAALLSRVHLSTLCWKA